MKDKIINVLWGIFAFVLGSLFIFGGIQNIFFEKTVENDQYNETYPILVGVLAVAMGAVIIYSWFHQRSKSRSNQEER